MDPIAAITKITGGVLRRIADAIDGQAPDAAPSIHIEVVHVHVDADTVRTPATRIGSWLGRS